MAALTHAVTAWNSAEPSDIAQHAVSTAADTTECQGARTGRPLGVGPTQRVRRGRELTLANGVFRLAGGHFRRARDEDLAQREAGVGGDGAVGVEVLGVRRRLGVAVAVDPLCAASGQRSEQHATEHWLRLSRS